MNKSAKLVLILSIAANAILFAGLAAGFVSIKKTSESAAAAQSAASGNALSPETAREVKALLATDAMAVLRDGLRALGVPEDQVKTAVWNRIASRYTARLREIGDAAMEAARQRPYWRGKLGGSNGSEGYTPEQRKEMREIRDEKANEFRQLFGVADPYESYAPWMPFLSSEKTGRFRELGDDYSDLVNQTLDRMAGFRMPGDEAELKLLDDEQKKDLRALMTPEEKESDDLRNSRAAQTLRTKLAGSDMTEDEYKAIYALQRGLDEKYPTAVASEMSYYGNADMSELNRARDEEQKNIDAQIKDMLGEERYADYLRGQQADYQSLQAAAKRFNLSADTVAQTYQARDDAANAAKQISDDTSLSTEQKNEAYAALAEQATGQIKASLGDEVGDAYIDNALPWLKNLPKGGKVTINAKGAVSVTPPKR